LKKEKNKILENIKDKINNDLVDLEFQIYKNFDKVDDKVKRVFEINEEFNNKFAKYSKDYDSFRRDFSITLNQIIDAQKKLFNVQTNLYDKDIGICCSCELAFHGSKNKNKNDEKINLKEDLNTIQEMIHLLKEIPDRCLLEKIKYTLTENKPTPGLKYGKSVKLSDDSFICKDNYYKYIDKRKRKDHPIFEVPKYNIEIENINYMNYYHEVFKDKTEKFTSREKREKIKKKIFDIKLYLNNQIEEALNFNKILQEVIFLKDQNYKKEKNKKMLEEKKKNSFVFPDYVDQMVYVYGQNPYSSDSEEDDYFDKRQFTTDSSDEYLGSDNSGHY